MKMLANSLNKMYEDICREEEYLRKHGLLYLHDQLTQKVEAYRISELEKKAHLDECFTKIIKYKEMEKDAVENIKENKRLVAIIYSYSQKIESKSKEINNLSAKRIIFHHLFRNQVDKKKRN